MSLRLTGGRHRGRVVASRVPSGVRPTSARVREALFSMVGHDLSGLDVLDAFGGTGLLGLEAWSRGASVTVVERDRRRAAAIRVAARSLAAPVEVVTGDVVLRVRGRVFHGVLADPPYPLDPGPILDALAPVASCWLVLEQPEGRAVPGVVGDLRLHRARPYGGTTLHVYRR